MSRLSPPPVVKLQGAGGRTPDLVRAGVVCVAFVHVYLLTCTRAGVESVLGRGNATIDSSSGSRSLFGTRFVNIIRLHL